MIERQPFYAEIDFRTESLGRVRRLPATARQYLRLSAMAQLKSIAPETKSRIRARACDLFSQMPDEDVEQLTGFLSWRQDQMIGKMKTEIAKRKEKKQA